MATSTLTVAASRAVHDSPAVSSMTKRKLQLVVGVILLVVWIVSVAFVGFLARHGSSLRSSVSAASHWSSLEIALHPNASEQRQ